PGRQPRARRGVRDARAADLLQGPQPGGDSGRGRAFEMRVPLIYFKGIEPGQYMVIAPVFVTDRDPGAGLVQLTQGIPYLDLAGEGLVSPPPARREAVREVLIRLRQQRFRREVLDAYRHRCTVCALKRRELVQAAHITEFAGGGVEEVTNGLALCAIHHLAYDRNLMGIDPGGVVHISAALRRQADGPMLRQGLQAFHGARIAQPHAARGREATRPGAPRRAVRALPRDRCGLSPARRAPAAARARGAAPLGVSRRSRQACSSR